MSTAREPLKLYTFQDIVAAVKMERAACAAIADEHAADFRSGHSAWMPESAAEAIRRRDKA
jgi:hypothetical protein